MPACATTYTEFEGECVQQEWKFSSVVLRKRQICDLPSPGRGDPAVRDRPEMNVNPFPGIFEVNPADSSDPNLLEKNRIKRKWMRTDSPEERAELEEMYRKLGGETETSLVPPVPPPHMEVEEPK